MEPSIKLPSAAESTRAEQKLKNSTNWTETGRKVREEGECKKGVVFTRIPLFTGEPWLLKDRL